MNKLLIICMGILVFAPVKKVKAQILSENQDTSFTFLIEKGYKLFKPHSELTFSFGTDELKNENPDLRIVIPDLKDTAKFFEELKGDYNDWYVFYKIGKLYQRFNKQQSAMYHFNQAYNLIYNEIRKDTLKSEPFSTMGSLYLNLNSTENAFYFFKRAYELNEKDSLATLFLPMLYLYTNDIKKSQEIVKKRLAYDPQSIEMYIWFFTSGIYQQIGTINREQPGLLNKNIDELFDFKNISEASKKYKNNIRFVLLEQLCRQLAVFAKYMMLSDDFTNSKLQAVDEKEVKNIQKNLDKILSNGDFKNKYILYKSLGFNYLLQKNLSKAIDYFNKSIKAWPADKNSKDYYILFTTHFFIQNDTLAAIKVIDQKIKNDSVLLLSDASDYFLKGNVKLAMHDYDGATSAYQDALKIQENPDAYLGLAILKMKDHKLKEANEFINKAYELNKEYYLTYALFGIITLMNNQKEDAKGALDKALQLKPDEKDIKAIYDVFFSK